MRDKSRTHRVNSKDFSRAELANRQHGVVSIRQLTGPLGYSRQAVGRATESGRLHRLYRGVYAVGHTGISRHGECLASVLACGPDSLLSHQSAAWLWGISTKGPHPIEVTTANWRSARFQLRLHQSRVLIDEDRTMQEGIPVTSLPRTLLDNAATAPSARLRRFLERAEELRLFDLHPVESLLDRSHGHPGAGSLRRALAIYRPPPFTRSEFERRFLRALRAAGLPAPLTGFNVGGYELDAYWPKARFAVELDAFETHGTRAAFERDRVRQEDLILEGVQSVRITIRRFEREPDAVVARVTRLLAQRLPG
jgi:very-short-patch-repair endonuclease